jgi:hypothetical protein
LFGQTIVLLGHLPLPKPGRHTQTELEYCARTDRRLP